MTRSFRLNRPSVSTDIVPHLKKLGYRNALVTGAGSGLGRAFAEALLEEGLMVWGTSRRKDGVAPKQNLVPARLDLGEAASIDELCGRIERETGELDLLVANAGYGVFGPFASREIGDWESQVGAMLTGTMRLVHRCMNAMGDRQPCAVVIVTSLATEFPIPFLSGYNAVKAGLSGFARGLMIESAGTGPTIVDFRPGDYRTSFNRSMDLTASQTIDSDRARRVGRRLDAVMAVSPDPRKAACDLVRAVRRKRHQVVRSGSFFQAGLAPMLSRLLPESWLRAGIRRYFRIN
jgi:NAD(P)-dependent dehydrogenase (short-subunit alcohol dehydrogenase family)